MTGGSNRVGEVILEFIPLGNAVKVSAVDAETGVEVAIVGPANAPRDHLEAVVLQKLRKRLSSADQ